MKGVKQEEVYVASRNILRPRGWAREGTLVNTVGTVKWSCNHAHRLDSAAVRCAETKRREWMRR